MVIRPSFLLVVTLGRCAAALVQTGSLRVFCYGDSLTAGTSPPLDDLYPYAPVLEATIRSTQMMDAEVMVRHRGLPGATAALMLQYADDEQRGLRALLRKTRPNLAIITAGTNDLGYNSESAPILEALCGLHELSHALGVATLAVGIPPSAYQAMHSEAAELANMVNNELRHWCKGCGLCEYVDHPISTWGQGDARWAPDGLHFSPVGYTAIGEGLAGVAVACLESQRSWGAETCDKPQQRAQ